MEKLFKPQIDLVNDRHLVSHFNRIMDFDPLKHYNIDVAEFQKWAEITFYEHIKPLDGDFCINDYNFHQKFFIREGSINFIDKDSAIKANLFIAYTFGLYPELLIKKEPFSKEEQEFIDICDIIRSTSEIIYKYGVPILLIKDSSKLTRKTIDFRGLTVHKFGIMINLNLLKSNDDMLGTLRHEFTHVIQNYKNSNKEENNTTDTESFLLIKLKGEFEAKMTDYSSINEDLIYIDTPMELIETFMGKKFKLSEIVDNDGWKRANYPEDQKTIDKAKNINDVLLAAEQRGI